MTKFTGGMTVQEEDIAHWRVTCNEAVSGAESVSFTVVIRRKESATVGEVQRLAAKRAVELLQPYLNQSPPSQPG